MENINEGKRVHSFLPSVKERIVLSKLTMTEGLIHFITGQGLYRDKHHQIRLVYSNI